MIDGAHLHSIHCSEKKMTLYIALYILCLNTDLKYFIDYTLQLQLILYMYLHTSKHLIDIYGFTLSGIHLHNHLSSGISKAARLAHVSEED